MVGENTNHGQGEEEVGEFSREFEAMSPTRDQLSFEAMSPAGGGRGWIYLLPIYVKKSLNCCL